MNLTPVFRISLAAFTTLLLVSARRRQTMSHTQDLPPLDFDLPAEPDEAAFDLPSSYTDEPLFADVLAGDFAIAQTSSAIELFDDSAFDETPFDNSIFGVPIPVEHSAPDFDEPLALIDEPGFELLDEASHESKSEVSFDDLNFNAPNFDNASCPVEEVQIDAPDFDETLGAEACFTSSAFDAASSSVSDETTCTEEALAIDEVEPPLDEAVVFDSTAQPVFACPEELTPMTLHEATSGDSSAANASVAAETALQNQLRLRAELIENLDDDRAALHARRANTLEYAAYIARMTAQASTGTGDAAVKIRHDETQHIVFTLDNLSYAAPLTNMAAIERPLPVTALPFLPSWHTGVANLRGDILSVVDLRVLLRMTPLQRTRATRVVVMRDGDTHVGFIVDSVRQMRRFEVDEIHPPVAPADATERRSTFVRGHFFCEQEQQPIAVLDAEALIAASMPKSSSQ